MKNPAQPPAQPPAKPVEKDSRLALLCFLLLVGATFSARYLFIVDNDIEIKTKFSGKSWQINQQMLRQYWSDTQKLVGGSLKPLGASVGRGSQQMLDRAGAALSNAKKFCIETDRVSQTFQKLNPLASKPKPEEKPEQSKSPPTPAPTPAHWCLSAGMKK